MQQEIEAERMKQITISRQADEMLRLRAGIKQKSLRHKESEADDHLTEAQMRFKDFENTLNDLIRTKGYDDLQLQETVAKAIQLDDTLDRTLNPNFEMTVNQ